MIPILLKKTFMLIGLCLFIQRSYAQSELLQNGDLNIGRKLSVGAYDSPWGVEDDDCVIRADSSKTNSDLILVANDAVAINLDDDDNSVSSFQVLNGTDHLIMQLEENGNLSLTGYTKLGSDAPKIKMKVLTGTSANTNQGATQIAHGLGDANRILGVQVYMNLGSIQDPVYYPDQIQFATQNFTYFYDKFNVTVQNNATVGTSIQNKPIRILMTYQ